MATGINKHARVVEGGAFAAAESAIYMANRESMRSALAAVIGVALDCQQRWSRGHPAIVEHAQRVLADMDTRGEPMPLVPRTDLDAIARAEKAEGEAAGWKALVEARNRQFERLEAERDAARAELASALGHIDDLRKHGSWHHTIKAVEERASKAEAELAHARTLLDQVSREMLSILPVDTESK